MAEVKLNIERREGTGKGVARRARAAGLVPGVIYGLGMDPVPVTVNRRELVVALTSDSGFNTLLEVELDGQTITTLARELQRDPVRGTLLHADFVKLDLKQEVEVEVPVHLVGEAPGVSEGGVLEQPLFNITVRCLPTQVPESVDADISGLNMGESLRVSDLTAGEDFEFVNDPDDPVASIVAPISEEELAAMEAEVAAEPSEEEAEAAAPEEEGAEAEGDADAQADEGGPGGAEQPSDQ